MLGKKKREFWAQIGFNILDRDGDFELLKLNKHKVGAAMMLIIMYYLCTRGRLKSKFPYFFSRQR